jgi:hypothetical protein
MTWPSAEWPSPCHIAVRLTARPCNTLTWCTYFCARIMHSSSPQLERSISLQLERSISLQPEEERQHCTRTQNEHLVVQGPQSIFCVYLKILTTLILLSRIWGSSSRVMKSSIFWYITPCSPLKVNRRFGGTCRLHLHGPKISQARNKCEEGRKQRSCYS